MKKLLIALTLWAVAAQADFFDDALIAYKHQNYTKAAKLFQQACDGGNAGGCSILGDFYKKGQGVKQSFPKAAKLYQQACDEGEAIACNDLGLLYINGQGVRQSNAKAKALWGKSCDAGQQEACHNYAIINKRGY